MSDARARLRRRFLELGIEAPTVPYPAHRTVEEGKALRGRMSGRFTKNLLLKDRKGRLFLVVAHEDRVVDLKKLHTRIGASGQLSFAPAERMRAALAIEPGALTPLALLEDTAGLVTAVIDAGLMDADQLNFHPLVNTESTGIAPRDLLAFIASCGREPLIVELAPGPD
ncbi:MAG: prolyl-tRNA synthetase associated domain-containing protein [Burkholderiaceae bacterium]|jgi:Ala-tRNA(Pro) deacylase